MQDSPFRATGLIRQNSRAYVEQVFALNEQRQPLVGFQDEGAAREPVGIAIDQCIVPEPGGGWFTEHHALMHDDLPAQVTFTSGTEGQPKGIVLSHSHLADTAERLIIEMALTAEVCEYIGVPVTHSFGMARIRVISAVGGRSYIPTHGFDPLELAKMLETGEINSLSATPTLLRILLQQPKTMGEAGKKLRWMEIGSQYMAAAEKRKIRELFPNALIVQHYGLTEASRTTFLQISNAPDELLESVGRAVGQTEVGISTEGRIRIRGPHVAQWRIEQGRLQALTDAEGWLQTSDLGHIKDGHLYFDGRADDLINTGGVKVNPDLLGGQIGTLLPHSGRLVVTKVPDALRGEGILVVAESEDLDQTRLRMASTQALKLLGLDVGEALHVRVMTSIPQTATGKPLRRLLSEEFILSSAARSESGAPPQAEPEMLDVLGYFQHFFPGRRIGADSSFESLGGDSLSYIQFSMDYEDRFGSLPAGWEAMGVAQLQQSIASTPATTLVRLEFATLTRAFFMVCILALHLDTFVYSQNWGAAYFMFLLAGYSFMRFQWPEISRTGKVGPLFATLARIAIPTLLIVTSLELFSQKLELKQLFLISNLFDPRPYHVATFYFVEIYIQLLLLIAGLFAIKRVQAAFRNNPLTSAVFFVVVSMALSRLCETVWDTTPIFHRTPIWYLWTVACGMLIASSTARDRPTRLLSMTIITIAVVMHHGFTPATYYICAGCFLLLFWQEISVPVPVKRLVGEMAGASMFMYLSHYQVKSLVTRAFHEPMPWLALITAIAVGIGFARIYQWGENRLMSLGQRHGGRGQQRVGVPTSD